MQENDPPYLTVGTEVSAKYKGAFCEAKIRKVVRVVKCKVTFKSGLGSVLLSDDQIKGSLRVGANVEARHPDKNAYIEAVINKIQDCSQYTVVFDDGDITTLRRSALCLKSGRHFNESDTLDHLPLTHPEHFSNPVVGGRRNVRRRRDALSDDIGEGDDSGDDESLPSSTKGMSQFNQDDGDVDIGKVVCVEITDKKKGKDSWFPAVIVSPSAQETVKIRTKDEYLVRSFRDGRYYTVPKKEITSFSKDSHGLKNDANSNILKTAIEKAIQFIDKNELPAHWDKDILFSAVDDPTEEIEDPGEGSESEDSEEDSQAEEKDLFVAKLYKYMEDRGTPINKVPIVCNRDLDLHKLYKVVVGRGGYNKVTNSSQWKSVTVKMGFGSMPSTSTINLVKQGYKKFIHNFEEFTRKLGCNFPAGGSSTSARANRIMFRDRHTSSSSKELKRTEEAKAAQKEATKEATPPVEVVAPTIESTPTVAPPTPTPPQPSVSAATEDTEAKKTDDAEEIPRRARSRQENRQKTKDEDMEDKEKGEQTPSPVKKRRRMANKDKEEKSLPVVTTPVVRAVSEPASSTSSISTPIMAPASPTKRSTGRGKYKRKDEKKEMLEPVIPPEEYPTGREFVGKEIQIQIGDKLSVYYGKESEGKKYEAKVVDRNENQELFFVHYAGWNTRYDEWIPRYRIAENLSLRTEQVTSVPQGRGPSQSSTSDGTVSDSGTPGSFKGPTPGVKPVKKKLKQPTMSTPANATKTKSNVTPRKRLSSEGDAKLTKRTRKRALSGGEPTGDSSESEGKAKPLKRIRKPKKIYDPGEGDWKNSVPSPDILDFSNEERRKEPTQSNQVIDLNKLRSEMKGIDKMVKVSAVVPEMAQVTSELPGKGTELDTKLEIRASKPDMPRATMEVKEETKVAEELSQMLQNAEKSVEIPKEEKVDADTDVKQEKSVERGPSLKETANSDKLRLLPEVDVKKEAEESKPETKMAARDLLKQDVKPTEDAEVEVVKSTQIEKSRNSIMETIEQVSSNTAGVNQVSSIDIIPAPSSKATKTLAEPITSIPRPPLPALLRASAPTPILPNLIPPVRSTTPITITIPPRAQRPILIKCPTPTSSSIAVPTTITISTPSSAPAPTPPQLIIAKPLITIPKSLPATAKLTGMDENEKDSVQVQQQQQIQTLASPVTPKTSLEKVSPTITLITTTSPVKGAALAVTQSTPTVHVRPKLTETGPKLASYPTARIRAPTGVSSGQLLPLTPGFGGVKKRRKVKSKQSVESSGSSDEQEAKRQKRQVYAPKTFKQVTLQVNQPPKTSQGSSVTPAATTTISTTIGAVVASASTSSSTLTGAPPTLAQKKQQIPSAKVTPILKVQYGSEKRPMSPGGKIVSGKYTRVEPLLKVVKKPTSSTSKSAQPPASSTQVSQAQQPLAKKVLPVAVSSPAQAQMTPISRTTLLSESEELKTSVIAPPIQRSPSPPTIQLPELESPMEEQEPFVPFKSLLPLIDTTATPPTVVPDTFNVNVLNVKSDVTLEVKKEIVTEGDKNFPVSAFESRGSFGPENENEDEHDTKAIISTGPMELPAPGEESCHSLLCEEEIPGSPTPGADSKPFLFEDTNAVEFPPHKMTLPVGRAESVLNQSIFSSPPTVVPPTEKALASFPVTTSATPTKTGGLVLETTSTTASAGSVAQERAFTAVSSISALYRHAFDKDLVKPKQLSSGEENQVENSPLPMSSTSSISTGSPRAGDGETKLSSGENKSKEPSDTDSIDCLPKCEDIVDEIENTSSDEDDHDGDKYGGRSLYEKSSGRSRSPSSSPRKRRLARRDSPDDSPPRSYRMGHRSSVKGGLDADYGRMPPPQPPVNLGKPPYSERYNFIPVLTDSMSSEERVDLCMTSMTNLREKWRELKAELSFYDRKKKRIRKRKREQEKREKEALLKNSASTTNG